MFFVLLVFRTYFYSLTFEKVSIDEMIERILYLFASQTLNKSIISTWIHESIDK